MNKTFLVALFLGSFGQIIWGVVFLNNETLFVHHWSVGGLAVLIVVARVFHLFVKMFRDDIKNLPW